MREIRNELWNLATEIGDRNRWLRRELISSAANVDGVMSRIDSAEEEVTQ